METKKGRNADTQRKQNRTVTENNHRKSQEHRHIMKTKQDSHRKQTWKNESRHKRTVTENIQKKLREQTHNEDKTRSSMVQDTKQVESHVKTLLSSNRLSGLMSLWMNPSLCIESMANTVSAT